MKVSLLYPVRLIKCVTYFNQYTSYLFAHSQPYTHTHNQGQTFEKLYTQIQAHTCKDTFMHT